MQGRLLPLLLLAATLAGCDSTAPPTPAQHAALSLPIPFVVAEAGTITGQVRWTGDLPQAPSYHAPFSPLNGNEAPREWHNPNLPVVNVKSHGLKDAVVFLRGIDAMKTRPWDHEPVRVEFRDDDLFVVQGDYAGPRGFVRRGDAFEVVSKQSAFEALQARGDAFFTLALPELNQLRRRRLDQSGIVELTSGVGRFWMRGHLFVADHPYYARTDADGRFRLPQVPSGRYQLVCWHPSWNEHVREHDADTVYVSRLTFRPAAEVICEIVVKRSETRDVAITLSLDDFPR